ncbi:MAG: CoA transferase [Planctomycetes bacterium]|nr:CoA transferase [Planctomycetota bacterium]
MTSTTDEPETATEGQFPPSALTGTRILDFTRYQQGPYATVLLADMGAEVIKVEAPGGEPGRGTGLQPDGFSAYFEAHNRGKKSMVLDLSKPGAIEAVRRIVPSIDVVTENFRPGVMERWGLGYEDLRALKEDIILASGSAWGREGPWGERPGYDHVGQALSGIMHEQGGGPSKPPHALIGGFADQIGAMLLAYGIACALVVREQHGTGQHVDVSLIGAMTAVQAMPLTRFLRTGKQPGFEERRSATYTHYECADGRYIAIAANTQAMWERMSETIGDAEVSDARFEGPFDRFERKLELVGVVDDHRQFLVERTQKPPPAPGDLVGSARRASSSNRGTDRREHQDSIDSMWIGPKGDWEHPICGLVLHGCGIQAAVTHCCRPEESRGFGSVLAHLGEGGASSTHGLTKAGHDAAVVRSHVHVFVQHHEPSPQIHDGLATFVRHGAPTKPGLEGSVREVSEDPHISRRHHGYQPFQECCLATATRSDDRDRTRNPRVTGNACEKDEPCLRPVRSDAGLPQIVRKLRHRITPWRAHDMFIRRPQTQSQRWCPLSIAISH